MYEKIADIYNNIAATGKHPNEITHRYHKRIINEYTIKRANCGNRWRDCKLLGSLLDTQNDIKRRKVFAINAANKLKHLFLNKDVTISMKTLLFKSYITPNFI